MAITNAALDAQYLATRFRLDFAEALRTSTARQLALAGKNFQNIVEAFAEDAVSPNNRKKINQGLADGMREAAVIAYQENVLRQKIAPSYRTNDRYSGGRLLHALQEREMAVGTADGIGFINVGILDAAARQWARLNFGASPGEGYSGTAQGTPLARIQFGSNQGTSLRLGGGMSPGFRVPQRGFGYFEQNRFFIGAPGRRSKVSGRFASKKDLSVFRSRPSSGIRPRRFLDQGLVSLAKNFAPAWNTFLEDELRKSFSRGRSNVGRT